MFSGVSNMAAVSAVDLSDRQKNQLVFISLNEMADDVKVVQLVASKTVHHTTAVLHTKCARARHIHTLPHTRTHQIQNNLKQCLMAVDGLQTPSISLARPTR